MSTPLIYNYRSLPVYQRDEDFLFRALSYKQEKLDTNRLKVQSAFDQYANLDIYKDVDRKYAEERLQQVQDFTNRYASGDLSDDNLVQFLTTNMSNVVDDKVATAVASTKKFKSQLATWAEAEKDTKSGKYSDLNRTYALSQPEVIEWLNSDKVGENYQGNAGFIEYVDVNKLLTENAQKLSKILEVDYTVDAGGNAIFTEQVTGKKVDRGRLESALSSVIDEKARRQMKINAWSIYGNLNNDQLRNTYNSYYNSKLDKLNNDLSKLETLSANSEGQTKSMYEDAIEAVKMNRSRWQKEYNYDTIVNTQGPKTLYESLYQRTLMEDMLDAYSYDEVVSKKVSDLSYKTAMYEQAERHHRDSISQKEKDRQITIQKEATKSRLEAEKNLQVEMGTRGTSVLVDSEGQTKEGVLEYMFKEEGKSYENITTILSKTYSKDDIPKIVNDIAVVEEGDVINKSTLMLGGKKIKLDKGLRQNILNYKRSLEGNTELHKLTDKETEKYLEKAGEEVIQNLRFRGEEAFTKVASQNPGWAVPTGRYVERSGGGYDYVEFGNKDSAITYYTDIIEKEEGTLSKADKLTLDIFKNLSSTLDYEDVDGKYVQSMKSYLDRMFVNQRLTPMKIAFGAVNGDLANSKIVSSQEDLEEYIESGQLNRMFVRARVIRLNGTSWNDGFREYEKSIETIESSVFKEDRRVVDVKSVTFDPKTKRQSDVVNVVQSDIGAGGLTIDKNQSVIVKPIWSEDEARFKGYDIEYTPTGNDKNRLTHTISDPKLIEDLTGITSYEVPLINGNVEGQTLDLGTAKVFMTDELAASSVSEENIPVVQSYALNFRDEMTGVIQALDKTERAEAAEEYNDVVKGDIRFKLRSTGNGAIETVVVGPNDEELYSTESLIKGQDGKPLTEIPMSMFLEQPEDIFILQTAAFSRYFSKYLRDRGVATDGNYFIDVNKLD